MIPPALTKIELISWLLIWLGAARCASVLFDGGVGFDRIALATPIFANATRSDVSAMCISPALTAAIALPETSIAPSAKPASHLLRVFMSGLRRIFYLRHSGRREAAIRNPVPSTFIRA